jgi:hypothetical protein
MNLAVIDITVRPWAQLKTPASGLTAALNFRKSMPFETTSNRREGMESQSIKEAATPSLTHSIMWCWL